MSVSARLGSEAHFSGIHNQKLKSNKIKKIAFQIFSGASQKQTTLNWFKKIKKEKRLSKYKMNVAEGYRNSRAEEIKLQPS